MFLFFSRTDVLFTFIDNFIDLELYNNLASCSLIKTIYLRKRNKRTANALTKQTIHSYLVPFACRRQFYILDFFFTYQIKFGKTKQIIVTLVTTAFKTLISIAKANVRLSGREFYAGNINNLFGNMLSHIILLSAYKKCGHRSSRTKTQTPIVAKLIFAKLHTHTRK